MDSTELRKLAERSRSMREAGMALIFTSFILAIFFFVPLSRGEQAAAIAIQSASPAETAAFADIPIDAKAAIVYDLTTGNALFTKDADAQLPLASLTKLLTVHAALVTLASDTPITIPARALLVEAPRAFREGQIFSLADLARLTLTASLNDGAAAIASAVAERENMTENEMLASAAAALDLTQTYAVNGHGLDVSTVISGGYGSARDLARLAGALAIEAPDIAAATTKHTTSAVSAGGTTYTVTNTDPMVDSIPGLVLSKTGYTDLAGGNLALVFDVGINHPIAVVVLGSSQKARFTDGSALVAATFAHFANSD